ncbi:MAG TPA: ferritin family protein [Patescibacteria group bacterium]|nr:ferritin family protein [Patescibacteria group bacterium]
MNNSYNVAEIIQMAINVEREGYETYAGIAKQAADEKVKAVFVILAEQEKKHAETFTNLFKVMSDSRKIEVDYLFDENVVSYFKALTEKKVFEPDRMNHANNIVSAMEAIKEGINSEKNSVLLYSDLLKSTDIPEVRSSLELIIAEEKQHIIDLTNLSKTF